jgi:hypothetical protein
MKFSQAFFSVLCSFRVTQKVEKSAYKLLLPDGAQIHNVFHVNQLKKPTGNRTIPNKQLPLLTDDGKIKSSPVVVLQRRQVLHQEGEYAVVVPQWIIHWDNLLVVEATWEDAYFIQKTFPSFQP